MWQLFKSRFGAEKCELSDYFIFNLAGILTTENLKKTDILKEGVSQSLISVNPSHMSYGGAISVTYAHMHRFPGFSTKISKSTYFC